MRRKFPFPYIHNLDVMGDLLRRKKITYEEEC
jgi:hypothetical protein